MKGLYDEAQKLDPGDAHDDDLRPAARARGRSQPGLVSVPRVTAESGPGRTLHRHLEAP